MEFDKLWQLVFHLLLLSHGHLLYLLLIGSGKLLEEIKNKIGEYGIGDAVTILSNRTDINELLKLMDVFVLPSKFEGLGIVAVEAQAVCFSDRFFKMNPGETIEKWADVILIDIDNYDIRNVIRKLEKIYSRTSS